MKLCRALLVWIALWACWMVPSGAEAKTVAIVVGNNLPPAGASGEGLAKLRYADDDAQRYAELFSGMADQTVLLTVYDAQTRARSSAASVDGPPTLAALRAAIRALDAERDLTVYLVFSGHGALDEAGAPFLSLLDGPLSRDVLFDELLGGLPAQRVHLIVDACHAAGVVGMRGDRFAKEIDGATGVVTPAQQERWTQERLLDRFPHVGVLASSSVGESSHEWSVLEAGVFSHEVLSGLAGAADINADLRIEYSEIQSFIASANRAVTDPRAKPKVVVHPPAIAPHAALVDLASLQHAALLEGDVSALGHFHIELDNGRRYLDAHIGGQTRLALPPGNAYVHAGQTEYALVARAGERIRFVDLDPRPTQGAARGSTAASYRRELFAEPYTYDYYRGYTDSVGATPVPEPSGAADSSPAPPPRLVTPPERDGPEPAPLGDPLRPSRRAGVALVTVAGLSGVTALATGIAAATLRSRFSAAANEREAAQHVGPHRRYATVAVITGVTAGVTGLVGALLLRRAQPRSSAR